MADIRTLFPIGVKGNAGPCGVLQHCSDVPQLPKEVYYGTCFCIDSEQWSYGPAADQRWVPFKLNIMNSSIPPKRGGTGVDNSTVGSNNIYAGPISGVGEALFRPLDGSDLPIVPIDKGGTGTAVSSMPNSIFATAASGTAAAAPSFRALVDADIPSISANKFTSGVLPIAKGGTGKEYTTLSNQVFATATSGTNDTAPSFRALVGADMPNISAAKFTSEALSIDRGGTGMEDFFRQGYYDTSDINQALLLFPFIRLTDEAKSRFNITALLVSKWGMLVCFTLTLRSSSGMLPYNTSLSILSIGSNIIEVGHAEEITNNLSVNYSDNTLYVNAKNTQTEMVSLLVAGLADE